ncbi:MAG: response regulator [Crocinitomicaceae bacterium]
MVSNRCKSAVKEVLNKLGLHFIIVDLGEVDVMENISAEQREQLKTGLLASGLELMEDKKAILIERIKNVIIEMVHHSEELPKVNYSDYISEKLNHDYTYLSNIFSAVKGITIQQFIITHKIERVKELLLYEELSLTEISYKMHYSSVAHLSNQFKKVTGLSTSQFKELKGMRRTPIEDVGSKDSPNSLNGKAKTHESHYTRSLIEASLDPLMIINTAGKITDINQATVNITGITREEISGTDFFDYFTEPQKVRKIYQEIFTKESVADSPLTLHHKEGEQTDVLLNGSVYKDHNGNTVGAVMVARDVTDQKSVAKELTEAKVFAELATDTAEKSQSKAESATKIAEDAVKTKQQFLSNMSHEIRTPMNAIIGFTKVLLKTKVSAKQKEYLQAIKLSGDALIVLINDILDLAKVDAGKTTFEQKPFKMSASISAMLQLFEPKIREKNLELIKEYDNNIPEVLVGDAVRLRQIILNLMSNAEKFTSKGSITVRVHLIKEDDDNVTIEFSIIDTGIGIAQNNIGRVFESFQQATNNTSKLYGGTGLGLAIVKQLVEAQGGTINIKSKIDEGSAFIFTLDFKKTQKKAETLIEMPETDLASKNIKILVVEDIPLNQLLLKTLLDDFGFESDIAANGKIAIEKLQNESYDIILMDLQMPEMNGFEATKHIRKKMNSDIPIMALTAHVTAVDLEKCIEVGMNDYITKPIDEKLLYSKIVGFVKKDTAANENITDISTENEQLKCIDLSYLNQRTKSNPKLMLEMISLYLKQTPALINTMKQSLQNKDWDAVGEAAHKMIPSFSIMGMSKDFEKMARKIKEHTSNPKQLDKIPNLVLQLENICIQACEELKAEYNIIKKQKNNDKLK